MRQSALPHSPRMRTVTAIMWLHRIQCRTKRCISNPKDTVFALSHTTYICKHRLTRGQITRLSKVFIFHYIPIQAQSLLHTLYLRHPHCPGTALVTMTHEQTVIVQRKQSSNTAKQQPNQQNPATSPSTPFFPIIDESLRQPLESLASVLHRRELYDPDYIITAADPRMTSQLDAPLPCLLPDHGRESRSWKPRYCEMDIQQLVLLSGPLELARKG